MGHDSRAKSRQSAKLFSSRLNWDSPTPHPQASVPPSLCSGGRGTLTGERKGGRVLIPTRGHTLWYSLYIGTGYLLCGHEEWPETGLKVVYWKRGGKFRQRAAIEVEIFARKIIVIRYPFKIVNLTRIYCIILQWLFFLRMCCTVTGN